DSSNYRFAPLGVVCARDALDIEATVAVCRGFGAPITARGAGTSLAGQTTNAAVILDCARYMRQILEIDAARRIARVEPGDLRDRYADLIRDRYPQIPRRVSGYNLDELLGEHDFHVARALAGSEGTLALTLEATVRLTPWPPARALLVLGYPSIFEAADHV